MTRHGTAPRAVVLALAALLALATFSAPAPAIPRSDVLTRAQRWIAAGVPYSQQRYASVEGTLVATSTVSPSRYGYRTDCSGFVSMCLGLRTTTGAPRSMTTANLDLALVPITKDELVPGDVILRPNDLILDGKRVSYGHALIFAGWLDAAHTRYAAYHESGSSKGAVRAEIAYGPSGFWSERGFAPYRCPLVRTRYISAPATDTP